MNNIVKIGEKTVGKGSPVFIVVEIGVCHDNADTAGYGSGVGHNPVSCSRNIVPTRGGNGSHGSHNLLSLGGFTNFTVNFLRWANNTTR